ncbi:MAG TPA: 2Fe-2S iron-sulfur cluster-binding protein [Steroidobacteraceae bacterium]|jgi:2Fe-2S ferredoxin|nr:2Fe-2S iron-sulfur cluster-binding protein [Steroidobacteraceae bacterium]
MTRLSITDRDGAQTTVEAQAGQSAMEVIRSAGVEQLLAMCGGVCACATCHVYVDPECLAFLPPMGSDEDELLSALSHRRENSRLACQIRLGPAIPDLNMQLAPED